MKDFKGHETQDEKKTVAVFHGLCKGCGLCIQKCPVNAISFSKKDVGYYSTPTVEIDLEKCIACGICETVCPDFALKIEKKKS